MNQHPIAPPGPNVASPSEGTGSPRIHPQTTQHALNLLALEIRNKSIVYILPPGCVQKGELQLTGGAYIQGEFSGSLICATGAVVIAPGAKLSGYVEADEIYVAGEVLNPSSGKSSLVGRELIAVSEHATVYGDLTSRTFNINNNENIRGAIYTF